MKTPTLAFAAACFALLPVGAQAGSIPYPNPGTIAPTPVITATASGPVVFYFFGFSASDTDLIKVIDTTTSAASSWFFDNQTTAIGVSTTGLANVNAGDNLEFLLWNQSLGVVFSSNPAHNGDGINHFYLTPFTGGGPVGIPLGTYLGAEDLPVAISDLDYNDVTFVITNVTSSIIPESASMALVGAGLLGLGLVFRRRRERRNEFTDS